MAGATVVGSLYQYLIIQADHWEAAVIYHIFACNFLATNNDYNATIFILLLHFILCEQADANFGRPKRKTEINCSFTSVFG